MSEVEIKKEEQKENEMNQSLNKSFRQNMMCNHCMYVCKSYDEMKEHYKSEFHKYNLNRVTMNLNPLLYDDYLKKKEMYMKKLEEQKKKQKLEEENKQIDLFCEICDKKFSNRKKLEEHLNSKNHKKNEIEKKQKEKEQNEKKEKETKKENETEINTNSEKKEEIDLKKEPEKTTLDDITICIFCNKQNENLEKNISHMLEIHKLDVPFLSYIKNYPGLVKLMAKKIFKYKACLTCDTQKFETYKSLQSHMIDKGHTRINNNDLDDFLFKYYDTKKLLGIKDISLRKLEEFKILSLRLKVAKNLKEKDSEGNQDWIEINENENEDFEPITLPNGELLLENGSTLGNKIYNIYYKQRIKIQRYENLNNELNNIKNKKILKRRRNIRRNNMKRGRNFEVVKGSNKGNYKRCNILVVKRPQNPIV